MRHGNVGSDHNLVVGKLLLKLRKTKTGGNRKRCLDVVKLKDPEVRNKFSIALKNRFSILQDEATTTTVVVS